MPRKKGQWRALNLGGFAQSKKRIREADEASGDESPTNDEENGDVESMLTELSDISENQDVPRHESGKDLLAWLAIGKEKLWSLREKFRSQPQKD
ncbi:hypothetical protein V5O48_010212 [Marasmius crinis-equi]|uniref:Uncharacterized protein n=1 Tax=Marasmius crinis-equi TaxID=585013 RepID=A0ABR3F8Y3_9AGAR